MITNQRFFIEITKNVEEGIISPPGSRGIIPAFLFVRDRPLLYDVIDQFSCDILVRVLLQDREGSPHTLPSLSSRDPPKETPQS